MNAVSFTKEGYDNLLKEQKTLLHERVDAVEHLKRAREMGDLSENGYYKASRMKLNSIDRRLRELTGLIRYSSVISSTPVDVIDVGATVVLESQGKEIYYKIVGEYESDPLEGKLSHKSPLGKLLVHKSVGDAITLTAPAGEIIYKIKEIR